jgi:deoxycytidylate deaminase
MARPPKHIVQFAIEASLNSPCRSKRGAALFEGDALYSCGWNHKPKGFECDGSEECKRTCGREAVHAEQMALIGSGSYICSDADMLHVKTVDGKLVPSGGPSCIECSKLILHSRIAGMWLYHEDSWKRYDAAEFHRLSVENHRRKQAEEVEAVYVAGRDDLEDELFPISRGAK